MTHRIPVGLRLALVWLITSAAVTGVAAAPVLVLHSGQEPLLQRLLGELHASDMRPIVMAADGGETPAALKRVVTQTGAAAGVQILPSGDAIFIWIAGIEEETTVAVDETTGRLPALLALKSAEWLRARLDNLKTAETVSGAPTPAAAGPSTTPALAADTGLHCGAFGVQPAVTYGFGDLPATLHLHLHLHVRLFRGLGLRIAALIPTLPMPLSAEEGSAYVQVSAGGVGLLYAFLPPESRLSPTAGLMLGPGLMRMRGYGRGDYRNGSDLKPFPLMTASLGLGIRVNRVLSLRAEAGAGAALARPVVRFGDTQITGWGRPLLFGMAGIEVWIF